MRTSALPRSSRTLRRFRSFWEAPHYRIDPARLEAAISPRTRALLLNTPHNPTGRVFDHEEIMALTEFVNRHNLILITDEIYDRILYDGREHVSPGSLDGLVERTVTVGGLGKSFAVTGWRLGYVIAREPLAAAIRAVHDYSTICGADPIASSRSRRPGPANRLLGAVKRGIC